jgi:hypothetical protein
VLLSELTALHLLTSGLTALLPQAQKIIADEKMGATAAPLKYRSHILSKRVNKCQFVGFHPFRVKREVEDTPNPAPENTVCHF